MALTTAGTGLYTWRVEPLWVEFVQRALPIHRLPPDLVGRMLVHLSDSHVGAQVDSSYLIRTCSRVRAMHPDFVIFTGDFVSCGSVNDLSQLRDVLRHFPRGRRATVANLGNHDYGPTWSDPVMAGAVAKAAADAGISVLRNQTLCSEGLQLIGLDDLWAGRFALNRALADADPSSATLVLSHNPDSVDLAGWGSYRGWILAGHTHGGQCKPPFLPPPILPVRNRRYTAGAFELAGGRHLYINRGVGHLLRVRFNVRPEVTVFHLQSA